jgi:hypothetical protein
MVSRSNEASASSWRKTCGATTPIHSGSMRATVRAKTREVWDDLRGDDPLRRLLEERGTGEDGGLEPARTGVLEAAAGFVAAEHAGEEPGEQCLMNSDRVALGAGCFEADVLAQLAELVERVDPLRRGACGRSRIDG